MLCFSIVLWLRRLEKSGPKNGRVRRICGPRCDKICTTPARVRAIWKSKSLKTGGARALLEVEVLKICTTPARQHDLEVKIVKKCHDRNTFGSWSPQNLHHACARERFGSQNRKKSDGVGALLEVEVGKISPRLRASTIWKSKSLKTEITKRFARYTWDRI